MTFLPSFPQASLMDMFQAYPDVSQHIHHLADQIMRGDSPFTAGERELIAAFVSAQNDCHYCQQSHTGTAVALGEKEGLVEELVCDLEGANIPKAMKPVLQYVQKLTLIPSEMKQEDVDAILSMGWDEKAVIDASLICSFFNFMNRWVDGLGLESKPEVVRQASEHLSKYGYQNLTKTKST